MVGLQVCTGRGIHGDVIWLGVGEVVGMDFLRRQEQTTCFMLGRAEEPVIELREDMRNDIAEPEDNHFLNAAFRETKSKEYHATHRDDVYVDAGGDGFSLSNLYDHGVEALTKLQDRCAGILQAGGDLEFCYLAFEGRLRSGLGWSRRLSAGAWQWGSGLLHRGRRRRDDFTGS